MQILSIAVFCYKNANFTHYFSVQLSFNALLLAYELVLNAESKKIGRNQNFFLMHF